MNDLRERAIESAQAMEQVRWERLTESRGDSETLEKKRRKWEVACYILRAVEEYEKDERT